MVGTLVLAAMLTLPTEPALKLAPPEVFFQGRPLLLDWSSMLVSERDEDLPSAWETEPLFITDPFERGMPVVLGRAAGFFSGAWASALAHEFGHALAAWGHGLGFVWPTSSGSPDPFLPLWNTRPRSHDPAQRARIAAGGFLVSFLSSEALLLFNDVPKNDVFVSGFLFYSIVNDVVYVTRDMVSMANGGRGIGDIRDMVGGGVPRELLYTVLIVHSALAVVRLVTDKDFTELLFWIDSAEAP